MRGGVFMRGTGIPKARLDLNHKKSALAPRLERSRMEVKPCLLICGATRSLMLYLSLNGEAAAPRAMLISGVWSDLKKRRILLVDHQNDHNQQKRIRHDRFYP